MIGFIRTLWHVPHALLNDAQALPHLFDTNCGTVVAVAILRRWNVELKLFVSGVGLPFSKSHSKPQARRFGPVTPHSIASSTVKLPIPLVRPSGKVKRPGLWELPMGQIFVPRIQRGFDPEKFRSLASPYM